MISGKYIRTKHSFQSSIADLQKLEKTHKSELRMISTMALKFKSKCLKTEDPRKRQGENEATNVRMYVTHFPGFCYRKDGKYRKKGVNCLNIKTVDSTENSEKVKALLFTENELDIEKVLCLHLLGTQVHSRKHIQRKDGRFCSFIKSQIYGNKRFFLRYNSQTTSTSDKDIPSIYDKMLPSYILDVWDIDGHPLNLSLRNFESDFEEDSYKWKKFQVPIYVNTGVKMIVSSVLEALEAVRSPKLKNLINLAQNPDELRNFLSQEYIQEYLIELAGKELIKNATAYEFQITCYAFEKNPSTTETVAQVLDIASDSGLRNMLNMIRISLLRRYEELVRCNIIPGKKKRKNTEKGSTRRNFSRTSFLSGFPSTRAASSRFTTNSYQTFMTGVIASEYRFNKGAFNSNEKLKDESSQFEIREMKSKSSTPSLFRNTNFKNSGSLTLRNIFQNNHKSFPAFTDGSNDENLTTGSIDAKSAYASLHQFGRYADIETSKHDLKSLNNSQRILLGLKVASMKCKPVNMHQFENKNNVDVASIISSITQIIVSEYNDSNVTGDIHGQEQKKSKRCVSKINNCEVQDLSNLTRETLSNFRHVIATTENKKRVKEFMSSQL